MGQIFQEDILNNARTVWPRTTKFGRITHMRRSVFIGDQPRSHPEGAEPSASTFLAFPSIYAYILWRRTTNSDVVMNIGRGLVFRGQPPHPKGAPVPHRSPIGGSLLLCAHPLTQYYQIWHDNTFTGVSHAQNPRGGVPALHIFGFSIHLLTQNHQIWRGNTYGEGLVLVGQPGPPSQGGMALTDPNLLVLRCLCVHGLT